MLKIILFILLVIIIICILTKDKGEYHSSRSIIESLLSEKINQTYKDISMIGLYLKFNYNTMTIQEQINKLSIAFSIATQCINIVNRHDFYGKFNNELNVLINLNDDIKTLIGLVIGKKEGFNSIDSVLSSHLELLNNLKTNSNDIITGVVNKSSEQSSKIDTLSGKIDSSVIDLNAAMSDIETRLKSKDQTLENRLVSLEKIEEDRNKNAQANSEENKQKTYLQLVYPVGSIFMSFANTSPDLLFGFGKWEVVENTFLWCSPVSGESGTKGGSEKHTHDTNDVTLTADQIPSHRHWISGASWDDGNGTGSTGNGQDFGLWSDAGSYSANDPGKSNGRHSQYTGGGKPHNHGKTKEASNMPPYTKIYCWKRTA